MKNRIIILSAILLIAALGYSIYMDNVYNNTQNYPDINPENNIQLEVSYTGPYNLDEIIHEIKNRDNNKEYNNDTLSWVESLKEKNVFISNNTYVIMNDEDANKIRHNKTIDITDAYIVENIECYVVENRSLGGNNAYNILLVRNVTDLGNKTYYYEV